MAPDKFISARISVTRGDDGIPVSFEWEGRTHVIGEIIAAWPDFGFSGGAPKNKSWRMRRHRNCYRVETTDGDVYELYHDRGLKPEDGVWVLLTRLGG